MKKLFTNLLFILIFLPAMAQSEKENAEKVVRDFFEVLSEMKPGKIDPLITGEFLLLEAGDIWNADSLKSRMVLPEGMKFQRINKLTFIKTEVSRDVAWTSYVNEAEFQLDGQVRLAKWLESAVLIKVGSNWKIDQLHSTKMEIVKVKVKKE